MRPTILALLLALAAKGTADAGQCPTCSRTWFQGTVQRFGFGEGVQTANLAVGDLDEDGRADFAAAGGTIFILLANTDGIFRRGPDVSVGNASEAVAMADMDGDGHLDVVAGGLGVGVTRGDGNGGFLPPSPGVGASAPIADLAIGDFDGDGMLDAAAVHGDSANLVSIYRGTGGGGLQLLTSFRWA
jgi:hypothetical protein